MNQGMLHTFFDLCDQYHGIKQMIINMVGDLLRNVKLPELCQVYWKKYAHYFEEPFQKTLCKCSNSPDPSELTPKCQSFLQKTPSSFIPTIKKPLSSYRVPKRASIHSMTTHPKNRPKECSKTYAQATAFPLCNSRQLILSSSGNYPSCSPMSSSFMKMQDY